MNAIAHRAPGALMIDIAREQEHWRKAYRGLPRAAAMRSFVRYWPVLAAAYDTYLLNPAADRRQSVHLFLRRIEDVSAPLKATEAIEVFNRVWARIDPATGAGGPGAGAAPASTGIGTGQGHGGMPTVAPDAARAPRVARRGRVH